MDLPPQIDDYIRESIDHCSGLLVSSQTLELKLRQLLHQNQSLLAKLKEKDELIERARSEATMNAKAVKRFVEENDKLASECENLMEQCQKLEKECALYDHDRETLMEFGNGADKRAREAHMRVQDLEQDLMMLELELLEMKKCMHQNESQIAMLDFESVRDTRSRIPKKDATLSSHYCGSFNDVSVDSNSASTLGEETLLDSFLETVTSKDESSTYAFLDAHSENESCNNLLTMWNSLKPSTQRVLSLVAEVKSLVNVKEHLRINLHRAEEEVELLFDENGILDEENKRLLVRQPKERNHLGFGGKLTSSIFAKSKKRKSSTRTISPTERKIDFDDIDSARQPLSPL